MHLLDVRWRDLRARLPGEQREKQNCRRRRQEGPSRQVGYCIAHAHLRTPVPACFGAQAGCSVLLCAACCRRAHRRKSSSRFDPISCFYGDNTEFRNPFREGETIFGAAVRVTAELALNDRVTVSAGGFANQRFGSEDGVRTSQAGAFIDRPRPRDRHLCWERFRH